jgi:hypothetical protein
LYFSKASRKFKKTMNTKSFIVSGTIIMCYFVAAAYGYSARISDDHASVQEVRLYTLPGQGGGSSTVSVLCDDAATCFPPDIVDDTFDSACVNNGM